MADRGDIKFDVDLSSGIVRVGVRPPLALEGGRVWAELPVLELQDQAAHLTLGVNAYLRECARQVRTGAVPSIVGGKPQ